LKIRFQSFIKTESFLLSKMQNQPAFLKIEKQKTLPLETGFLFKNTNLFIF